jgi:hypothetical protein
LYCISPLKGCCILTGAEYLLAKSQGCLLKIEDIHLIPFRTSEDESTPPNIKPFETILKLVQEKRREHDKGTICNLMYKEIGIVFMAQL